MAVSDIIISPAKLYWANVGTALPDETSVAYDGTWSSWNYLGTTLEPVKLTYNRETFELEVQQALSPLKHKVTKEVASIETILAEVSASALAIVMGGTSGATAAGSGQKGYFTVEAGGDGELIEYAWGFEGYSVINNVKQPTRWFFYRGVATPTGEVSFAKAEPAGLGIRIDAHPDTTLAIGKQLWVMHRVTAAAT